MTHWWKYLTHIWLIGENTWLIIDLNIWVIYDSNIWLIYDSIYESIYDSIYGSIYDSKMTQWWKYLTDNWLKYDSIYYSNLTHWWTYLNSTATRFWTSVPPCPLSPGSLREDCAKFARFLTISTHSILHSGVSECAPPHAHEITTIDSIGTRRCCMAVWASFVRNLVILLIIKTIVTW